MVQADLGVVAAIERETLSPWSSRSLADELAVRQAIQCVAESSDDQILGWCACRVIWPEAELLKITVRKMHRKHGVGWSLLKHLLAELQKREVASLFLEVRSKNHPALNFYAKHGFSLIGSRPNYYTDPSDSAMILKRNVSRPTIPSLGK
jgi:ribosomal-protein-alanine N-acetyltransferase